MSKDESTKEEIKEEVNNEELTEVKSEEVEVSPEVEEINALKAALDEMEDKFLRTQAELANMRNRHKKEREDASKYRSQDLAKSLLPALDNLDRALEVEADNEHSESMKKGIEMVRESLVHALSEVSVEEIPAMGEIFDPNLHQAVQTMPATDDQKTDEIINVLQKGYKLHDRVLRPTMVIVAQ